MSNEKNHRSSASATEVEDEVQPKFMSVKIHRQQPLEYPLTVHQQPLQGLKRSSNRSEVKDNLEPRATWINGFTPDSAAEFRRSRTSFEVSNTNSKTIAKRIFDSNENRSIYAVYDESIMSCKTASNLIFTVRIVHLFEKENTLLIDVRRRRGCSLQFRDEFQALFRAATLGEITPIEGHRSMTRLDGLDCTQIHYIPLQDSDIESSLKIASVNIESKMYDACLVSLHDLSLTTDPQSKETSSIACKLILDKYFNIFDYVVDDIQKHVDYSCANRHNCNSEEYMRGLTLGLLGNILMVLPNHSVLTSLVQDVGRLSTVIKSLQWYLRMAEECPSNSSLASKILRLFVEIDSRLMRDTDTNLALEDAKSFGKQNYPSLEKEAQAALIAMEV